MKVVPLGSTGVTVSRLGLGTGTSDERGRCRQARMDERQFLAMLRFAHERGVNHWDTATTYGTQRFLGRALREIPRDQVTLTTKLSSSAAPDARRDLERALRELGTDHVDVCLIHGVRNRHDLRSRGGVLEELSNARAAGKLRALGLSSHGLQALELALEIPEIEVVWARINYTGLAMDKRRLGLYDTLASRPRLKRIVTALPKGVIAPARATDGPPASRAERRETERLLAELHARGKGVIGMKIFAEGQLAHDPHRAWAFVSGLAYLDAFVVGMLTPQEIEENCRLLDR